MADLAEALERVLAAQAHYSFTNSPEMVGRRAALDDAAPLVEGLLRAANASGQLQVQFSNGAGNPAKVPWLRVFDPAQSASATTGWYIVFLFAADGSNVALSLNQGVTRLSATEITQSVTSASRLLARGIETLAGKEGGRLVEQISLADPGLGRKYESGHLVGFAYQAGEIPSDQVLAADLLSLVELLALLPASSAPLSEPINTTLVDDEAALKQISDAIYWDPEEVLEVFESLIDESPQIVLTGPPGSGKTFVAQHLAAYLLDMPSEVANNPYIEIVQFHPSYGYEDFVEGLRPAPTESGGLEFQAEPGVLLRLVDDMAQDGHARVLIIDEMNRANLPRVFGELMFLLEYRDQDIRLTHRGRFSLPKNLYIIGTMNTADRSAAGLDLALRRRFDFHEAPARGDILRRFFARPGRENELDEELFVGFESLNALLAERIDRHHAVGHSYLMKSPMTRALLRRTWARQIQPLIEEYFYDRPAAVDEFQLENFWPNA